MATHNVSFTGTEGGWHAFALSGLGQGTYTVNAWVSTNYPIADPADLVFGSNFDVAPATGSVTYQ